jgi:plastocyanin
MRKPGIIAFPVIVALGAITGYITYIYFTGAIPQEDRIDSPYYEPLSPGSGGNETGSTSGIATETGANATSNATTSTNATANATANATTTGNVTGGNVTGAAAANATNATGTTTGATTTGGGGGGATTGVSIVPGSSSLTDTAYQPNPVQVSVGDTVTWTNDDTQPHTVTSGQNGQPDGKFDSSPNFNPLMAPGQTFSHTFTEAGQYPYYCALHPNMVGTVIVS